MGNVFVNLRRCQNMQGWRDSYKVNQKTVGMRTVLNLYGIFFSLSLLLSIITIPISLDENLHFYYNEELKMKPKEVKEFLLFIFCSAILYFTFINYYYRCNKN
jgi:hypothetical protein